MSTLLLLRSPPASELASTNPALASDQPAIPEHVPVPTEDSTHPAHPLHIDGAAVHALLANPALWTALAHDRSVSVCPAIEAFGLAQPPVRRAAWAFVDALLRVRARAQGKRGVCAQRCGLRPFLYSPQIIYGYNQNRDYDQNLNRTKNLKDTKNHNHIRDYNQRQTQRRKKRAEGACWAC